MNWDIESKQGMKNAVEWVTTFLQQINEGGLWVIPRSSAIYEILHSEKRVIRVSPAGDKATERVLKAMGWTVDIGEQA